MFFKSHDYGMEKKGRCDAGQPLQEDPEPSGHAHKAKPPEPSNAEIEAHNFTHLPNKRWCPICVRAKRKESPYSPYTSTSGRLPIIQMDFAFMGTKEHRDKSMTLFTAIDADGDGDRDSFQERE